MTSTATKKQQQHPPVAQQNSASRRWAAQRTSSSTSLLTTSLRQMLGGRRALSPATISRIALSRHKQIDGSPRYTPTLGRRSTGLNSVDVEIGNSTVATGGQRKHSATVVPTEAKKVTAGGKPPSFGDQKGATGLLQLPPRIGAQRSSLPDNTMNAVNGAQNPLPLGAGGRRGTAPATSHRRGSAVAACKPTPSLLELAGEAGLFSLAPSDLVFESSPSAGIQYYDFVLSAAPIFTEPPCSPPSTTPEEEVEEDAKQAEEESERRKRLQRQNKRVFEMAVAGKKEPLREKPVNICASNISTPKNTDPNSTPKAAKNPDSNSQQIAALLKKDPAIRRGLLLGKPSTASLIASVGGLSTIETTKTSAKNTDSGEGPRRGSIAGFQNFAGRNGGQSLPASPRPSKGDIGQDGGGLSGRRLQQRLLQRASGQIGGYQGLGTSGFPGDGRVQSVHQSAQNSLIRANALRDSTQQKCIGSGAGIMDTKQQKPVDSVASKLPVLFGYRLYLARLDSRTNVDWFETATVPVELLRENDLPDGELALATLGVLVWGRAGRFIVGENGARLLCLVNGGLSEDSTASVETLKRAAARYRCTPHVVAIGQRRRSSTGSTSSRRSSSTCSSTCSSAATTTTGYSSTSLFSGGCAQQYFAAADAGMRLRIMMCKSRSELPTLPTNAIREARFLMAPSASPLLCLCFPLT